MHVPKTRREREIWQACDDIVSTGIQGNKVTGDAIRERLYELGFSKGSPNEIYKYRKNWREARGIVEEDYSQPTLSQVMISDPISRAVESVRTQIRHEASVEIEKIRREAHDQIKQSQTNVFDKELELNNALAQNQALSLETSTLKSECLQIQLVLTEERQQKAVLEQRVKSIEDAYDVLKQETDKLLTESKQSDLEAQEHLKRQLLASEQLYRKELEDYKTTVDTQQRQWVNEVDRLKAANRDLDIALGKMESKQEIDTLKSQELSSAIKLLESKVERLKLDRRTQEDKTRDTELKLMATDTELKQIKNQYEITQELHLEQHQTLQNKLQIITKLEERNRQLQAIITEKYFTDIKLNPAEQ